MTRERSLKMRVQRRGWGAGPTREVVRGLRRGSRVSHVHYKIPLTFACLSTARRGWVPFYVFFLGSFFSSSSFRYASVPASACSLWSRPGSVKALCDNCWCQKCFFWCSGSAVLSLLSCQWWRSCRFRSWSWCLTTRTKERYVPFGFDVHFCHFFRKRFLTRLYIQKMSALTHFFAGDVLSRPFASRGAEKE